MEAPVSDTTLRFEVANDDAQFVSLVGDITEHSDFDKMPVVSGDVVLDLSAARRVNSFGLRSWIAFLEQLTDRGPTTTFVRCSSAIVRQFNMVPSACKGVIIQSAHLPYFCAECDDERELLIDVDGKEPPEDPPEAKCGECGEEMEFDDVPEAYFAFWRGAPDLDDDP